MKKKVNYIIPVIVLIVLLAGIRSGSYFISEYFRYDEDIENEITRRINKDTGVICLLIPRKLYYRIGERPELDVVIVNKTDSVIYLPGNMDGSSLGMRLPATDFKVLNRNNRRHRMYCATFNRMVPGELTRLAPGECFNPLDRYRIEKRFHEANTVLGFDERTSFSLENYWPHEGLDGDNFLLPGSYDVQFIYSTVRDTTDRIMFGFLPGEWDWPEEKMPLLDSIPQVELKSNVVRLRYGIF